MGFFSEGGASEETPKGKRRANLVRKGIFIKGEWWERKGADGGGERNVSLKANNDVDFPFTIPSQRNSSKVTHALKKK